MDIYIYNVIINAVVHSPDRLLSPILNCAICPVHYYYYIHGKYLLFRCTKKKRQNRETNDSTLHKTEEKKTK